MFYLLVLLIFTSINADINDKDLMLSLMGNLEGRSIIIKVQNKDGKKIGVFKPNSGSTVYIGEYASYKLGVLTGEQELYPGTVIECMSTETQKKIRPLLAKTNFTTIVKEENRLNILQEIDRNIQKQQKLCGAFKVWINNIQFYYPMGTLDNLRKHPVFKYMLANGPRPSHKKFEIKQCTQLVEPTGCIYGTGYLDEMAKDMSSIMLLDAVIGNRDRFPGGNVHFRVNKDKARLFSLDNGAVLKPADTTAISTLRTSGVSRFKRSTVMKLKELKNTNKEAVMNDLKITPEEYEILRSNLELTLSYVDKLQKKYKGKIWF